MAKRDDDRLELRLTNKLANVGLRAPCRIQLEVYRGTVTLKGLVQFDYQKRAAIRTVRSMDGVQGVIDQLKVEAPVYQWQDDQAPSTTGFVPPPETE